MKKYLLSISAIVIAVMLVAFTSPTKDADQVDLYYFEGMPYKQIAEILPMKYQAIRNCVHEALKVLRKNIESRPL